MNMSVKRTKRGSTDIDGNGLVDGSNLYKLVNDEDRELLLRNWQGRTYSDASTKRWNAVRKMEMGMGKNS